MSVRASDVSRCEVCQKDASSSSHYTTPAHLLNLTNFASKLAHTATQTRTQMVQVARMCKAMGKKLDRVRPHMQQERNRQTDTQDKMRPAPEAEASNQLTPTASMLVRSLSSCLSCRQSSSSGPAFTRTRA